MKLTIRKTRRECLRDVFAAAAVATFGGSTSAMAAASDSRAADSTEDDSITVNGLDPSALTLEVVQAQRAGGVNCWVKSTKSHADFATNYAFMAQHSDQIVPAFSVRDIISACRASKIALVFEWQDSTQLMEDGSPYSPAINNLRNYHSLGLRICGIAYNVANSFGGGVLEPRIGLTLNGRELVEQIHKLKIVLDVGGHTGEQTSLDAIAMSSGVPVICSHTNMLTLVNNPRNTSDRLIEAIARTGGVIGVTAFNDFHIRTENDTSRPTFPQVSLDKHLDQYDYLKKLVGVDHIGLAPDFLAGRNGVFAAPEGASKPLPRLNENGSVNSLSPQAYSTWPWNEDAYVDGFDSIDKLPNVLRGLAQRGWTSEEIRKVMGENWLRVYRQVWGA